MSVIVLLLIVSISIAALFLLAFIWNVKNGQYDDETAPAIRILFDDKKPAAGSANNRSEGVTTAKKTENI
ncbi:MAG: cbb3-type cytochrome oxidase assembly protein CcoS [Bacteroidota bacterium]|jgi:cbb3-type cytochrome oxidase maturation protein